VKSTEAQLERARRYYIEHREERKRYARNRYHSNPKAAREATRNGQLKRHYGISLAEYNMLLEQQNGVCAVCEQPCPTGRRLAVDHDHETGRVRGLLCRNCNSGIGYLGDTLSRVRKAVVYLEAAA
jgi:hypothetical protein